jgi:hypothetical protein
MIIVIPLLLPISPIKFIFRMFQRQFQRCASRVVAQQKRNMGGHGPQGGHLLGMLSQNYHFEPKTLLFRSFFCILNFCLHFYAFLFSSLYYSISLFETYHLVKIAALCLMAIWPLRAPLLCPFFQILHIFWNQKPHTPNNLINQINFPHPSDYTRNIYTIHSLCDCVIVCVCVLNNPQLSNQLKTTPDRYPPI